MFTFKAYQTKPVPALTTAGRSQKGFAFIVVLAVLFLVTGLALVAFNTSDTDRQIASNNLGTARAYYAAEAGIIRANAMLDDSTAWRAGYTDAKVGNAAFSVLVIDSMTQPGLKDSLILRSHGLADDAESRIDVKLVWKKSRFFRWATFGDSDVTVIGNAEVDAYNSDSGSYVLGGMGGDIGSNGDIKIGGSAEVYGDVAAGDTVEIGGSVTIYGTLSSSEPPTKLEPISQDELDYALANNDASTGMVIAGTATYDTLTHSLSATGSGTTVTLSSGVYYFSNVSFSSNANLVIPAGAKVSIYMVGNFDASGGTIMNTTLKSENLLIYSSGSSIDLTGSSSLYAGIYAPDATLKIAGGANLYGAVICNSIYSAGNGGLHFDRALYEIEGPVKPRWHRVSWRVL